PIQIKEALHWCIYQHDLLFRETPTQSKLIIEQLVRSEKICDELAYKVHMTKLEADSREEDLIYLFEWNELKRRGRHKERFAEFLRLITRTADLHIDDLEFTQAAITCNFTMEGDYQGIAYLKRNKENTGAILSIEKPNKELTAKEVVNYNLIIKNQQNMFHLYLKDNHGTKKKRRHSNKLIQ
ncbi:MAG: hypothetical protein WBE68_02430, partial [Candidatus Nitrosopolaris sp.]